MTKKILAYGAYGIQNSGDDAPLVALMSWLRLNWDEDFDLGVISRHRDTKLCSWTGGRFIQNLEYPTKSLSEGKSLYGLQYSETDERLEHLYANFAEADLLLLGAGNFLNDRFLEWGRGPLWHAAAMVFLADITNTPVFLFGAGSGPLSTKKGKRLAKWILDNCDNVLFRKGQSMDVPLGYKEANDPAFLLPSIGNVPKDNTIAVALRNTEQFCAGSMELISRALEPFRVSTVQMSTYKYDMDPGWEGRRHPNEHIKRMSSHKVCFTSRLHGAVYALLAGCTPVAIDYFPKVGQFMRSVGLEHFLIGFDQLKDTHYVIDLIGQAQKEQTPICPHPPTEYLDVIQEMLSLPKRETYSHPTKFLNQGL